MYFSNASVRKTIRLNMTGQLTAEQPIRQLMMLFLLLFLMLDGSPKVGMSSVLEGDEVVIPGKKQTRKRAK